MQLGEKLREARLEKDLAIDDIQNETKIQKRYLEALEKNEWSAMPGNFYVRAFVREYAEVVGLNGDELLEEHAEELPSSSDKQYDFITPSRSSRTSGGPNPVFKFLPKILVIILVVLIAFAIYYAVINFIESGSSQDGDANNEDEVVAAPPEEDNSDQTQNDNENAEESEQTASQPDEEEEEETEPTLTVIETDESSASATYELTNADQLDLSLESIGESWLEIYGISDSGENRYYYDMINTQNSPIEPEISEDQVRIVVGRSHEVSITVNGNELEYQFEPNTDSWQYVRQEIIINLVSE
ncbi:hypothetical protein E3U55_04835 [Filobacillus milosensis]|uniref:Helix-turn-helix domain-containing protein n=1 Tax=Filobacillus milosensis TaxID=94137 RepID=A0A4Y8INM5_9BACI|nr:helix-turn-helix domain-containing protein [Filobacillus milosensis]TFB23145.1 hypothetical protein E3U55_04835 [Filobacillus milosensis]